MGEKTASGYVSRADGKLSIAVLHEAYGLFSPCSNVPAFCDRLASAGFAALAPDLYDGAVASGVDDALRLMRALDPRGALNKVAASMAHLRQLGATHIAVLGFCMGGGLSFRSALELTGLACAVMFYATPHGEFHRLQIPILGHFARRDAFVSLEAVRDAEQRLVEAGKPVRFHYYDAEHSFMNETLPAFAAGAASMAWDRTVQFLRTLGSQPPDR
jgi:carboxymethylenebutenolidase